MRSTLAGLATLVVLAASPLHGQLATGARQTLTLNPIGLTAGFYSAEYERAVHQHYTISLGGSHFSLGDDYSRDHYSAADLRARFYPGKALEGFSVGLSAGVIRLSETNNYDEQFDGSSRHSSHTDGVTVGSTIEYSWLLGQKKSIAFSLGGGIKRVIQIDGNASNATLFYPTLRSSFGIAF